jgi:hypothetical protein
MENNEVLNKFIESINNNSKAVEKMTEVLQAVINNNNYVVDNVSKLNGFASETFSKFNNLLMVIDAMSICLFEKNLIEEKRFQEVMEKLALEHEKMLKDSKEHKCNGECSHETKREADSVGTEK